MEFPDLGDQCSERTCKQLDFLPIRCGGCHLTFCRNHYSSNGGHSCTRQFGRKENVVPECPICCQPIPIRPGEDADMKVGEHIDTLCRSQPAKELKGKIFRNHCQMRGCKKKELLPIRCPLCQLNFCLTHRHELDHNCQRSRIDTTNKIQSSYGGYFKSSALAAVRRAIASSAQQLKDAQKGLSDSEALRIALEASKSQNKNNSSSATTRPTAPPSHPPPPSSPPAFHCDNQAAQIAADAELAAALAAMEVENQDINLFQQEQQHQRSNSNNIPNQRTTSSTSSSSAPNNGCKIS